MATLVEGQYSEAPGYFQKRIEIFGEDIEGWDIACSLSYLGEAATSAGSFVEAKTIYRDAYVGCRYQDGDALVDAGDWVYRSAVCHLSHLSQN